MENRPPDSCIARALRKNKDCAYWYLKTNPLSYLLFHMSVYWHGIETQSHIRVIIVLR
jgi:hypothetical protein